MEATLEAIRASVDLYGGEVAGQLNTLQGQVETISTLSYAAVIGVGIIWGMLSWFVVVAVVRRS